MQWINRFELFLFDFDGLLVNTEELHYKAYITLCKRRGFDLPWDFKTFCSMAHRDANYLSGAIYAQLPELQMQEPNFSVLWTEKYNIYLELLHQDHLRLMPGVESLLHALEKKQIKRCVVTNARVPQIEKIKSALPLLNSIPHWITREQYTNPKPDPECYQKAIAQFENIKLERIIGFEDSLRGLRALQQTGAFAVLVAPESYPQPTLDQLQGADHFTSFERIPSDYS